MITANKDRTVGDKATAHAAGILIPLNHTAAQQRAADTAYIRVKTVTASVSALTAACNMTTDSGCNTSDFVKRSQDGEIQETTAQER